MKILLIGGAGYIGARLCELLNKKNIRYGVLDINTPIVNVPVYYKHYLNGSDYMDFTTILTDGYTHIINLSGLVGEPQTLAHKKHLQALNVNVPKKLAELCKVHGIKLIHISSCSVYGFNKQMATETSKPNPIGSYGKSKLDSEKAIMKLADYTFRPVILRLGTVYGWSPNMRYDLSINSMLYDAVKSKHFHVFGGGVQERPFVHIDTVINAIGNLIDCKKASIYNVVDMNAAFIDLGKFIKKHLHIDYTLHKENEDGRSYSASMNKLLLRYPFKSMKCEDRNKHFIKTLKDTKKKIKKHLKNDKQITKWQHTNH